MLPSNLQKEKLTTSQKETLQKVFKKYNLGPDDVFAHKHFVIFKRSAIEKMQGKEAIKITYDPVQITIDFACIKATATKESSTIETFGSAAKANCQSSYFAEMAEKRAMSRAVLKMLNLYELGMFGEDENVEANNVEH